MTGIPSIIIYLLLKGLNTPLYESANQQEKGIYGWYTKMQYQRWFLLDGWSRKLGEAPIIMEVSVSS